ncbi:MAG: class I SAM-dependent methyltransferase [Methanoregulaceae archaeon]
MFPGYPAYLLPVHPMTGLFTGKSGYYAKYRRGYPEEVFDTIIARFGLTPTSGILDLGCGTGNVALPLARRGFRVHAVDPEPEMLAEGKRRERESGSRCPVSWVIGADTTLDRIGLPPVRICTMGLSFHWMDRSSVLRTLDTLIEPGGGIACISRNDSFYSHLENGWGGAVKEVLREMLGESWDYSGRLERGRHDRQESFFAESPFLVLETFEFPVREELMVDDIIGQQLSTSYIDPVLLGERNAEFRELLTRRLFDLEPSGKFMDECTVNLLIAKRG